MSTLVLGYAGKAVGTALGGPIGGLAGGLLGIVGGSFLDQALLIDRPDPIINLGQRLSDLYVTGSSEGAIMARVYGRIRVAGQIIWATKLVETQLVEKVKSEGGKGLSGEPKSFNVSYSYTVSFAVALCEGKISHLGRVWADGKPIRLADYRHRLYPGGEAQQPDPKIEAVEGAGNAPAYRGVAYLVFEDMPLAEFGNRVPVITAEVIRQPPAWDGRARLEDLVTAVTLIPAMGEFAYSTNLVSTNDFGELKGENTISGGADILTALDQLELSAPNCRHVSLVVSWHGTDLRLASCRIVPKAETATKITTGATWMAGGLSREQAEIVSLDPAGSPFVGGAPSDLSIVQAIQTLRARGYSVTLYPFIMMDIPPENGLPDPYGRDEQPPFPWRGRITCHPAPGRGGSPDKSAAAASQVAAFFGQTSTADLSWNGLTVVSARPAEWSFRRFILHCARLAQAAGGVDAFLIGSEMIGLTTVRASANQFPAVAALKALAGDVRGILGGATTITYGADWTEYANYRPSDGSDDVFFHLDPLWSDPAIDCIGIDNYMPIADWREGFDHLDARAGAPAIYDRAYLQGNVEGGELFDWYYPSDAHRDAQNRVPITDGLGEPWIHRIKDLRSWWSRQHHNRPGGQRNATPTAWVPESKPIRFTELGCPAIDKGPNQPNVFVDAKSAESFEPYYSLGRRDLLAQRAFLEAVLDYWRPESGHNPVSSVYDGRMVDWPRIAVWTWDARPYPDFPEQTSVWRDAANYRLGHWINGRTGLAPLADVVAELCRGSPAKVDVSGLHGLVEGYVVSAVTSPRDAVEPLTGVYHFQAAENGDRVVFGPLARAPVATYTADDLVLGQGGRSGSDFTKTRGEEFELPGALALTYVDPSRDYRNATVSAQRQGGSPAATSTAGVNLVLDEGAAKAVAEVLLQRTFVERERLVCALPPSALALDPGDVITLELDGRAADYRLRRIGHEGGRALQAVRSDTGLLAFRDGGSTPRKRRPPATLGVGLFEILDLPMLRASAEPHAPYIASYSAAWSPVAVLRSEDGVSFEDDTTVGARLLIGRLHAPLHPGPLWRWDVVNELYVDLPRGTDLASRSDRAVLDGANTAAIKTLTGWEVLQWAEATLISNRRYRLTRLLRGQLGTEVDMGAPTPAGSAFVVLTDALVQSTMPLALRGVPQTFRFGPRRRPSSDPSYQTRTVTIDCVGLRPLAPVHARLTAQGDGDLKLTWIRRTRQGGDAWERREVPLSEEDQAYEIDILDGGIVRRTLEASAPFAIYSAAMQAADFGSPVAALQVGIHQISNSFGRGAALRATLYA